MGTSWYLRDVDHTSLVATRRGPAGLLGGLALAGRIEGGRGVAAGGLRRYASFALMYLVGGSGRYRDGAIDRPLVPGSLVSVVPGHPHWYGVVGSGHWDEVYLVFDGPVFALAMAHGLIDPGRPVRSLAPVPYWLHRIDSFRTRRAPRTAVGRDHEALDVVRLLGDIRAQEIDGAPAEGGTPADWFARSQELLETDLAEPVDLERVADTVGMPYETWRRRFRDRAGCAPARYRLLRRVDAASTMLAHTSLTTRDIAGSLGFCDEHHLIRHFRSTTGRTPRQFRDTLS